jgi:hypothetical protein
MALDTEAAQHYTMRFASFVTLICLGIFGQAQKAHSQDNAEESIITIAEARSLPEGSLVEVMGIVTRARGNVAYIQDETAGIEIGQPEGFPFYEAIDAATLGEGASLSFRG